MKIAIVLPRTNWDVLAREPRGMALEHVVVNRPSKRKGRELWMYFLKAKVDINGRLAIGFLICTLNVGV